MLSQQETVNAIAATKLIVQHVSHESEALAGLLVSIRTRLADAVANLTVCSENQHLRLQVRSIFFVHFLLICMVILLFILGLYCRYSEL